MTYRALITHARSLADNCKKPVLPQELLARLSAEIDAAEETQHQALREAVAALSPLHFRVVIFRYWERLTILQIAKRCHLGWDAADLALTHALSELRHLCAKDPRLSGRRVRLASI